MATCLFRSNEGDVWGRSVLPLGSRPSSTPSVSVILPVHGVERYLEKSLVSVQRQTLREIEIIPVNDASPDDCQTIIDRLATKDPRIRSIIIPQTEGQGFARNRGLEAAAGKYIWFLDSDDWLVDPQFLEKMVRTADLYAADMTRAKKACEAVYDRCDVLERVRRDPTEAHFDRFVAETTYAECPDILHSRHFCLWLYRRDFLQQNDVRFLTPQWEERAFLVKALTRARRITLTTNPCFIYRIRPASTARREKSQIDLEMFTTNFQRTCSAFLECGAKSRQHKLRTHLEFNISQFIHYIFFGEWFSLIQAGPNETLIKIAELLHKADFRPEDMSVRPHSVRRNLFHGKIYALVIVALRSQHFERLELVVSQKNMTPQLLDAMHPKGSPPVGEFEEAIERFRLVAGVNDVTAS